MKIYQILTLPNAILTYGHKLDYDMVMRVNRKTKANVAKFKSHLGKYMRLVKQGEEVTVLDRQTPVAKLIPYSEEEPFKLEVIKATAPFRGLDHWLGKPIKGIKTDSLSLLREDRTKR